MFNCPKCKNDWLEFSERQDDGYGEDCKIMFCSCGWETQVYENAGGMYYYDENGMLVTENKK